MAEWSSDVFCRFKPSASDLRMAAARPGQIHRDRHNRTLDELYREDRSFLLMLESRYVMGWETPW
jgi:hypothetical protein